MFWTLYDHSYKLNTKVCLSSWHKQGFSPLSSYYLQRREQWSLTSEAKFYVAYKCVRCFVSLHFYFGIMTTITARMPLNKTRTGPARICLKVCKLAGYRHAIRRSRNLGPIFITKTAFLSTCNRISIVMIFMIDAMYWKNGVLILRYTEYTMGPGIPVHTA